MTSSWKYLVVSSSTILVIFLLIGARHGVSANSNEDQYRHLAVYTEVLSRIKSDYVEEPDLKDVTLGAVNGLLEAVDPFASYLNADQYKQYLKAKDAARGDVGAIPAGPWDGWIDRDRDAINVERAALLAQGDDVLPPSMLKAIGLG
jgi:carboxyl-terminal processing protease